MGNHAGCIWILTVSLKLWPQVVTTHGCRDFYHRSFVATLLQDQRSPARKNLNEFLSSATKKLFTISIALVAVQIFWEHGQVLTMLLIPAQTSRYVRVKFYPTQIFKQGFDFFQSIGPNYSGGQMDHDSRVAIHLTHRFGSNCSNSVLTVHELSFLYKKISNISPRACIF